MSSTNSTFIAKNGIIANGSLIYAVGGTTNVGINNTSPDAALTVTGTANVQGNVVITGTVNTSANVNVTGSLTSTINVNTVTVYASNASVVAAGNVVVNSSGVSVANTSGSLLVSTIGTTQGFFANATLVTLGNNTVNTQINTTHFFTGNSTSYGFGNSTYEALVTAAGGVNTSVYLINSSSANVGNSTVYGYGNSVVEALYNLTTNTSGVLTASNVVIGNSTANSYVNSTTVVTSSVNATTNVSTVTVYASNASVVAAGNVVVNSSGVSVVNATGSVLVGVVSATTNGFSANTTSVILGNTSVYTSKTPGTITATGLATLGNVNTTTVNATTLNATTVNANLVGTTVSANIIATTVSATTVTSNVAAIVVNTAQVNATGNVTVGGLLNVTGNAAFSANVIISGNLYVTGAVTYSNTAIANGSFIPGANSVYTLGNTSYVWSNIYATNVITTTISGNLNAGFVNASSNVYVGVTSNAVAINTTSIQIGNASVNATINSTTFTGTSNSTNYVGSVSAANVVSNAQLSANLGNYQTITGLSANVATLTANNSTNFNGQPASYYTNASNLSTGTLPYAQIPTNIVNTTAAFTITGNTTFTGNTIANGFVFSATSIVLANGALSGASGKVLMSNSISGVYWGTVTSNPGTVTSIAFANGLNGGTITSSGTVYVANADNSIAVSATGVSVNTSYIQTTNPGSWANSTNGFGLSSSAWAAPGPIGTTTANAANFTTLNAASLSISGAATISGNLTVTGNLTLAGTTTFINSTVITTNDLNLVLANSATNAITSNNSGIVIGTFANLIYNSSIPAWQSNVNFVPAANNLNLGTASFVWNVYANNISGNGSSITSVNAIALGGVSLSTLNTAITSNAATAYANAVANTSQAYANATNGLAINGTSNNANYLGGVSLSTLNTAITSNAATAVANAVANTSQAYANATNGLAINGTSNNASYLGGVAAASYALRFDTQTITSSNTTGFNSTATSAVALQVGDSSSIRNAVSTGGTMFFDVGAGGTTTGSFIFRTTNSFTTITIINGSGTQTTSLGVGTAPSGTAGEIRATNNITAYYSDGRLKDIEGTISNPIEKIKQISGVYYRSNEIAASYGYTDTKTQVGVIAQEIENILPEIVVPAPFDIAVDKDGNEYSKSGENYKTVHYEKIIPLLIEAIKELSKEVDMLKSNKQ